MNATVTVESGNLVIRIPLQDPKPSKTGKTLLVASTGGFQKTTAEVDGKPVTVGVNAFIPREG